MEKKTLVSEEIEAGRELVHTLEREGLPIAAAMWLKRPEDGLWQLYIASPDVQRHGPIAVYRFIDKIIGRMPSDRIKVDDVVAANTTNHFVNAIAEANSATGKATWLSSGVFNGMPIEDGVIYKIARNVKPSPTPPKPKTVRARQRA